MSSSAHSLAIAAAAAAVAAASSEPPLPATPVHSTQPRKRKSRAKDAGEGKEAPKPAFPLLVRKVWLGDAALHRSRLPLIHSSHPHPIQSNPPGAQRRHPELRHRLAPGVRQPASVAERRRGPAEPAARVPAPPQRGGRRRRPPAAGGRADRVGRKQAEAAVRDLGLWAKDPDPGPSFQELPTLAVAGTTYKRPSAELDALLRSTGRSVSVLVWR